jgi:hypothetical protein
MPIVAVFQSPGLSQDVYRQVCRRLTNGKKDRMETAADWPVAGLLAHIAGQGAEGFRVVDVWESEEAFRRFGEKLIPIMQEIGIEGQPDVYPPHAFLTA